MMIGYRYIDNTVTLQLDKDVCIGCSICCTVCPHRLLEVVDNKLVIKDKDLCMECGACAKNCPTGAITVNPGVGCAEAIINSWLAKITGGKINTGCC